MDRRVILNWVLGVAIGVAVTSGAAWLAHGRDAGIFTLYGGGLGGMLALASDLKKRYGVIGCVSGLALLVLGISWPFLKGGNIDPLDTTYACIIVGFPTLLLVWAVGTNWSAQHVCVEED